MFLLHVCSRCLLHTLAWHLCSHASPVFANAHVPPFEHVMRKTECTKSHGSVGSGALGVLEACSWKALSGENTPPYLIVSKKAVECWLESDYNGGPRPWLQEGDLGGVSCVLGDKRRLVCVCVWRALGATVLWPGQPWTRRMPPDCGNTCCGSRKIYPVAFCRCVIMRDFKYIYFLTHSLL